MAKKRIDPDQAEGPKPDVSVPEYNRIVDSAKLQTVQALKVAFEVSPDYYDEDVEKAFHVDRQNIGTTYDANGDAVAGSFAFSVTVKAGRNKLLKARGEYLVIYAVHSGADPAAAEAFCTRVGHFAAYPYFRAMLSHLSWESNANLPPLPVIATRGSKLRVTEKN